MALNKRTQMEKLNEQVRDCNKCKFNYKRIKTYGRGSLDSNVFLCGSFPWFKARWLNMTEGEIKREAYRKSTSFGDKAGELLSQIFRAIRVEENKVYVTNIVRCSQCNNLKPPRFVVKKCSDFLVRELRIVNPKVIFAASKLARKFFKVEISGFNYYHLWPVVGVHHPGFLRHKLYMFNAIIKEYKNAYERFM